MGLNLSINDKDHLTVKESVMDKSTGVELKPSWVKLRQLLISVFLLQLNPVFLGEKKDWYVRNEILLFLLVPIYID